MSDVVIRRFNRNGTAAFRAWLAEARTAQAVGSTDALLWDESLSKPLDPVRTIGDGPLQTKRQAAERLDAAIGSMGMRALRHDAGLWTWLGALFFASIVGERGGKPFVFNDYCFVFEPDNSHHFYRCLLFVSWWTRHETTSRARVAAPSRLILDTALNTLDAITTEVMKRLFLIRIPAMFDVLDRLYWDEKACRAKRSVAPSGTARPGDLNHRLPLRVRQLEKTFDLHSLDTNAILELLGKEFEPWWKPTLFDRPR